MQKSTNTIDAQNGIKETPFTSGLRSGRSLRFNKGFNSDASGNAIFRSSLTPGLTASRSASWVRLSQTMIRFNSTLMLVPHAPRKKNVQTQDLTHGSLAGGGEPRRVVQFAPLLGFSSQQNPPIQFNKTPH